MTDAPTVYVVDDDPHARSSLCALAEGHGFVARAFPSAEAFLAEFDPSHAGCLVTDIRLDGMSGRDLQQVLEHRAADFPVILISGCADTRTAVEAMRDGAVTVLEKSCSQQDLMGALVAAVERSQAALARQAERMRLAAAFAALTTEEREVLDLVVEGLANKQAASRLGVSIRTVEDRRRRIMKKLNAGSFAELVKLTIQWEQMRLERPAQPSARPS
jgi:two-component system response regulator FixJ